MNDELTIDGWFWLSIGTPSTSLQSDTYGYNSGTVSKLIYNNMCTINFYQ